MADRVVLLASDGRKVTREAVAASGGATDASKLVLLGSDGKVSSTMLPPLSGGGRIAFVDII